MWPTWPLQTFLRVAKQRFQFIEPGLHHVLGILTPELTIEQFERQRDSEAARRQVVQQRSEWRDAITRKDAVGVGKLGARRIGRVVIEMENMNGGRSEKLDAAEIGPASI